MEPRIGGSGSKGIALELIVDVRRHAYGQLTVLENVGFTVRSGEVVCVIGPSGCGKSTLLGIVGGLLRPTEGEISYRGAVPSDCLNPFTYIFQDFALLPWRSVAANVDFALAHHRLSKSERARRISNALQRTGLHDFASVYPKQLSGGMRQRVGIARALAVSPAVLLMDEPLSALDAQTRELLMQDFADLWLKDRITAMYVTHNLHEAVKLGDRIVVLSRRPGRIKEIITVDVARESRDSAAGKARLGELADDLWSLIRDEAAIANLEVNHE